MKRKNSAPFLVIIALTIAALACALPTPPATATTAPTPAATSVRITATTTVARTKTPSCNLTRVRSLLSKKDNNKSITLNKGEIFAISLDGNPTTGFEWTVEEIDNNFLHYDAKDYVGTGTGVGSGGTETLCFTAMNIGQTLLSVIYHRTFEKNVPPADVFKITVEIK